MKRRCAMGLFIPFTVWTGCGDSQGFALDESDGSSMGTTTMPTSDIGEPDSASGTQTGGTGGVTTGEVDTDTDTDTDIPPEVCPGPDDYEENDVLVDAHLVMLDDAKARAYGGVSMDDADFFAFDSPLADPVQVVVSYTAPVGDPTDLTLYVLAATGQEITRHQEPRTDLSEIMTATWQAADVTTRYFVHVVSNDLACMPYRMDINGRACTDKHEDNDSPEQAKPIGLDPTVPTVLTGMPTIYGGDPDYYQITASSTDPMAVKVVYTPSVGNPSDLSMIVLDAIGMEVGRHSEARTGASETMEVSWMPKQKNSVYRILIESDHASCVNYDMEITPRACTDGFEDNDSFDGAKPIPEGKHMATIGSADSDHYLIEAPGITGSCTVTYTVDAASTEDLTIHLFSAIQKELARHEQPRAGATEVMRVAWNDGETPSVIRVSARDPNACTTYSIQCESE